MYQLYVCTEVCLVYDDNVMLYDPSCNHQGRTYDVKDEEDTPNAIHFSKN